MIIKYTKNEDLGCGLENGWSNGRIDGTEEIIPSEQI